MALERRKGGFGYIFRNVASVGWARAKRSLTFLAGCKSLSGKD